MLDIVIVIGLLIDVIAAIMMYYGKILYYDKRSCDCKQIDPSMKCNNLVFKILFQATDLSIRALKM